jgi:hypothetical protein
MAKCVVCTRLNMGVEANKHPNHNTETMTQILDRRWNNTSKRENNRYCALHSTTGTGRATGEFIGPATRLAKEREESKKAEQAQA